MSPVIGSSRVASLLPPSPFGQCDAVSLCALTNETSEQFAPVVAPLLGRQFIDGFGINTTGSKVKVVTHGFSVCQIKG